MVLPGFKTVTFAVCKVIVVEEELLICNSPVIDC